MPDISDLKLYLDEAMAEEFPAAQRIPQIYVASRASAPMYPRLWKEFRSKGYPIISSWIDQAGPGETESMEVLWSLITNEIRHATVLCFYSEITDLPVKGALVEVGMALMHNIPVYVRVPGINSRVTLTRILGSWMNHPNIIPFDSLENMMDVAAGRRLR